MNEINWKSLHLSDYIEEVWTLINIDACRALETVQNHLSIIKDLAFNWSNLQGDIFNENQQLIFEQILQKHLFVFLVILRHRFTFFFFVLF